MAGAHTRAPGRGTAVQQAALLVGVVFLIVGVLGFVPGVTTDFDSLEFAERDSGAELFGVFQVSILHNLVHALFGIVGVALSRTARTARSFLIVGGVVYLALWIYGLVIDKDSDANFVPLNSADDWLHFGLGLGMVVLGLALTRGTRRG
ncbi:DUF4383 domain-containing protein [Streptomyces vilmorinianum]|uniref:DUF4383 domain-containing protein n=1 Tax=Streptomyces vilmorinianum TaxID=3051092 RepID=UPI00158664CB|nr:DUF4383 domain-containing protein [Streptomyces vilmorinianum]